MDEGHRATERELRYQLELLRRAAREATVAEGKVAMNLGSRARVHVHMGGSGVTTGRRRAAKKRKSGKKRGR